MCKLDKALQLFRASIRRWTQARPAAVVHDLGKSGNWKTACNHVAGHGVCAHSFQHVIGDNGGTLRLDHRAPSKL